MSNSGELHLSAISSTPNGIRTRAATLRGILDAEPANVSGRNGRNLGVLRTRRTPACTAIQGGRGIFAVSDGERSGDGSVLGAQLNLHRSPVALTLDHPCAERRLVTLADHEPVTETGAVP